MSPLPTPAIFGGLGFAEMLLIAFVAILVFGGRLPEVMRNLGQAYARLRRGLSDMSRPIRDEIQRATTLAPEEPAPRPALEAPPPAATYDVGVAPRSFPSAPPPRPVPPLDEPPPV